MMRLIGAVLIVTLLFGFSFEIENQNVTFIIISQNNEFNDKLGREAVHNLKEQYKQIGQDEPKIYVSNKDFPNVSADWTIVPLITPILAVISQNTGWVIFLEDRTKVSLPLLLNGLEKYDSSKEIWIGHALHDSEATIIHHFAFYENPTFFKYPNLCSGMALTQQLLKRLKSQMGLGYKRLDFHIDPAHEFALFVYNEGQRLMIQHDPLFCCKEAADCATYPEKFKPRGNADYVTSLFFAIKTCQKFHNDRIAVVKNTWHKYARKSVFFSDVEDPDIPTKSLGVPNTEQGHCQKTVAILRWSSQEFDNDPTLEWLALVDDDTILSVSRISNLITCHKNSSQPLILGERYRFGAQGFNYPTGGAGILINRAALKMLQLCNCPRPDSPDDMVLGACAVEYGVTLVHIPQMHQARPTDYAPGRLATNDAISFHKHWMIDPVETYMQWFSADDQKIADNVHVKSEL